MRTTDFKTAREVFREYYSSSYQVLRAAEESFRTLIIALTADDSSFPTPTVESRTKLCESCIQKFDRRYRTKLEQDGVEYEIREHVTDIIGIRIICLYEADIPKVRALLEEVFQCLDVTDKTSDMEKDEDRFGYKGLHLDFKLNAARRKFKEYRSIKDFRFEVQLRTIVQDAWSVLDHKLKYKRSIPLDLKRRINVLAALFELADREFLAIRVATEAAEREAAIPQAASTADDVPAGPLDVFVFIALLRDKFPEYNFISYKVDGFLQELLTEQSDLSRVSFLKLFESHIELVERYADFRIQNGGQHLNPFTIVRHVLYRGDSEAFAHVLFESQKKRFEDWLALMSVQHD